MNSNYVMLLNVGDLSSLFTNANYTVNELTLELNQDYLINSVLSLNTASVLFNGVYGGNTCGFEYPVPNVSQTRWETPIPRTLGYRLLEIAATNIFGDARRLNTVQNTSAIRQDSRSVYTNIANQLQTSLTAERFSFWNFYNNSERGPDPDPGNFNLQGLALGALLSFNAQTVGKDQPNLVVSFGGHPSTVSDSVFMIFSNTLEVSP